MARKRVIHPGFFKNEDIAEMSYPARLMLIGMWNLADREGRIEDRPKKLRGEILPYDTCNGEELVAEIADKGFIVRYEVDGNRYIQINNWLKYQDIHPREADSIIPAVPENNQGTTQGEPNDNLSNSQDAPINPCTSFPSCTSIPSLVVVTAREEVMKEVTTSIWRIKPVTKTEERDLIADMVDHYPRDWLIEAINIAVIQEARAFQYVDGILANWRKDGFSDTEKPWEERKHDDYTRKSGTSRSSRENNGKNQATVDWANEPDHL